MCVDDSKAMRHILKGCIEVLGYDSIEAIDGQNALELLDDCWEEVSLIMLDWNMPKMDGFTCLEKIKDDERFCSIPVLMVTTEAERENITAAIKAGAKHYITKPFSQQDLTTRMMECMELGCDMF